jgi:hypothetical protein
MALAKAQVHAEGLKNSLQGGLVILLLRKNLYFKKNNWAHISILT